MDSFTPPDFSYHQRSAPGRSPAQERMNQTTRRLEDSATMFGRTSTKSCVRCGRNNKSAIHKQFFWKCTGFCRLCQKPNAHIGRLCPLLGAPEYAHIFTPAWWQHSTILAGYPYRGIPPADDGDDPGATATNQFGARRGSSHDNASPAQSPPRTGDSNLVIAAIDALMEELSRAGIHRTDMLMDIIDQVRELEARVKDAESQRDAAHYEVNQLTIAARYDAQEIEALRKHIDMVESERDAARREVNELNNAARTFVARQAQGTREIAREIEAMQDRIPDYRI
ncbi:hypothetical protein BU24DRAFT_58574 [Aaosphaeria arxii CBS 175.79]|uniref:Uncharacterized protein n=1 Tax=Aaosphaeria arxii CBS 175.79 TaxID=1450172 RepID=A0A6A5XCE0_9PLEO|nr:uncharacterized protein BU24DRAFT_58574 [Aaosphaeria arxii CBS 175.79]KAF2010444.1 hypothetical protein BU24DRAFT_58574 [Aaosphaeria arxii CBS 175.79]